MNLVNLITVIHNFNHACQMDKGIYQLSSMDYIISTSNIKTQKQTKQPLPKKTRFLGKDRTFFNDQTMHANPNSRKMTQVQ